MAPTSAKNSPKRFSCESDSSTFPRVGLVARRTDLEQPVE
jgi:hypothetical protein